MKIQMSDFIMVFVALDRRGVNYFFPPVTSKKYCSSVV